MRMCKTLADMPSDLALEAVDKFAMASLDTVRSKTGFMVGQHSHALFSCTRESAQVTAVTVCQSNLWADCRESSKASVGNMSCTVECMTCIRKPCT